MRAATDIETLIGEHTALKRVGQRLVGLCPFHAEKSPSFSVNRQEGLYYCFGCQASGDVISFVRRIEGCDFVEAVERLGARAGITIRNDADPEDAENRNRRNQLYDALGKAAEFYHERLLAHPSARTARQYLRSRGYDGEIVRQFRLGFAGVASDDLVRSLAVPTRVLVETGLAFDNNGSRARDVFRERVIFPIFDPGGRVIALGGRSLPEELRHPGRTEVGPKYRNTKESSVYQKRATLYGLNWSKTEIAKSNEAIVCEGYTDVIGFFQAGVPRAVASCGTALTEDHFRLLSRFAQRIVLCFDADNAGQNAAARLYEWERRHDLELRVAALPSGTDPAELARSDPEELRHAVEHAEPFLGFRVTRALVHHDLSSPEGRAKGAEAAVRAIAEHPNELVRDQYLIEVADRTHHDPARLRELLASARREAERAAAERPAEASGEPPRDEPEWAEEDEEIRPGPARSRPLPARGGARAGSLARAGRDALVLAISRPDEAAPWFDEVLFTDVLQRQAFRALCGAAELHEAIDNAPAEVADLIKRLAASGEADQIDPRGTYVALVRLAGEAALREVEADARRAQLGAEAAQLADASELGRWVKGELELLRDPVLEPGRPSAAIEAAGRLLAWLRQVRQEGNGS